MNRTIIHKSYNPANRTTPLLGYFNQIPLTYEDL